MSNQVYNQLLSEYGRDFHDTIISALKNQDRVECLAYALQFCEWITSVLTNGQPSNSTVSQRVLSLGGAKDYQSKEGNILTPQKFVRVYPGMETLVEEIHSIRSENVRRPDIRFLPNIITDLVAIVESQDKDPVTTFEDAQRYVEAHNYAVQFQNHFHSEEEMDMDVAYELAAESEFFTLSVPSQCTLAALVYLSNDLGDFTAGQVSQIAGVSDSELKTAIEELKNRNFIDRVSGSRFSNTVLHVEHLSMGFVAEFISLPSDDLSDMGWKEAVMYATLCALLDQDGISSKKMRVSELVQSAFRGRYATSGGDISTALRTLQDRGFISIDRSVSPYEFSLTERNTPADIFSSLPTDELYEVADVLRREPTGVRFSFEQGQDANRVQAVNSLVTQWEQDAINREILEEEASSEDTVVEEVLLEEEESSVVVESPNQNDTRSELTYDQVMGMVRKKYERMSGGEVIKDVLGLVSSIDKESITIDATIEGSTYRRIEIVFNDEESGSRF